MSRRRSGHSITLQPFELGVLPYIANRWASLINIITKGILNQSLKVRFRIFFGPYFNSFFEKNVFRICCVSLFRWTGFLFFVASVEDYAHTLEWLCAVSQRSRNFFMSSPLEERNRASVQNIRTGTTEQAKRTVRNVLFNHVQKFIGVHSFVFAER